MKDTDTLSVPLRILLVEDNAHDQRVFRRAFQRAQILSEITVYERAEPALDRLRADSAKFDLVVVDYNLPGMSGFELCKALLDSGIPLPLVLLTGGGSERLAVRALKAGVDDYMVKDPDQGYLELLPIVLPDVVENHQNRLARERVEQALQASEARYRAIVEDQIELIYRYLPNGTLTFANDAYCRYFGKPREAFVGHTLEQIIPEEYYHRVKNHLASLTQDNPVATIEYYTVLPDGQTHWHQWVDRAIFDDQGELIEYQSVGRDVTERRRAERALQASEAHYRAIVEDQTELICRFLSDTTLTFVNEAYCRYFGKPREALVGHTFTQDIFDEDREKVARHLAALSQDNPVASIEERVVLPNGEVRWQQRTTRAIFDDWGKFIEYQSVGRDITERKRANDKLRFLHTQLGEANDQLGYLLKRFVPERVAQRLISDHHLPHPGGEQQRISTILFADMRNFTAAAESVGPSRALDILNAHLAVINKVVQHYQGSIIQYVGDLVMVAFNVPDDQPDHPLRAARAALDMRDSLEKFIAENQSDIMPPLRFGFGLHTGTVVAGYLGAEDRYTYAAVGDATNVAYHICSQAAGGQIIISQATLDLLDGQAKVKPLDAFPLKRRRATLAVYELEGLTLK